MAKLTEGMVIGRTRATDLSSVRKLNCWGSELSDVSLVRQMTNVEVLSLSVNQITQLIDFAFCPNLQELYVRRNLITDLNQILYLRDLPNLRHFWLEDNPCAIGERYRLTVLKYLPNLKKLDNVTVNADEVRDAAHYGLDLALDKRGSNGSESLSPTSDGGHTTATTASSPSPSIPVSGSPSPPATGQHLTSVAERDNELDLEGNICPTHGSSEANRDHRRSTGGVFDSQFRFHESNHTNVVSGHDHAPADDRSSARMTRSRSETTVTSNSVKRESALDNLESHLSGAYIEDRPPLPPPSLIQSSRERDYHETPVQPSQQQQQQQQHQLSSAHQVASMPVHTDAYSESADDHEPLQQPPRYREDAYRYPAAREQQQQHMHYSPVQSPLLPPASAQQHPSSHQPVLRHHTHAALLEKFLDAPSKPYPIRPKNRNSNILSAVLCLIKELDCASLEVVEMAARCRMQELDE